MISKFEDFIKQMDEASLQGSPGIPGESGKKGEKKYLKDVEQKAIQKFKELERTRPEDLQGFMDNVSKAQQLQSGHEAELEKLAEKAIRLMYGSILDGVVLNIKFPKKGEIQQMMKDVNYEPPAAALEELTDKKIIDEIHKRKILNNITQGEAKNSKRALNLSEVKSEIKNILGAENGEAYLECLNKITDVADFFDWMIPMEVQKQMWKESSENFSGSVKVEWKPENKPDEEDAKKLLDELTNKDEIPDEAQELFDEMKPTINALGTDFAMLIHETVKGIYELITSAAIPEDENVAKLVIMNTDTLADEIEDLRFGPYIAADLRDFLNTFPEIFRIENLREHVLGKLLQIPTQEFLNIMLAILNGDESVKPVVKKIITEVEKELKDFDYKSAIGEEPDSVPSSVPSSVTKSNVDPSKLSKKEIHHLIDLALDNGDFAELKRLSKFLGESEVSSVLERIEYMENFIIYTLNENVQEAKNLLVKVYAAKNRKDPKAISDEEKKHILQDPKFLKVKQWLESKKQPGLTFPFTRFYILENASWDQIEEIFEKIQLLRNNLHELRLKKVDAYARLPFDPKKKPAWEQLVDDLNIIEKGRKVKKLYNALGPKMKKQFDKCIQSESPEDRKKIETLANIAQTLDVLPDSMVTDDEGNDIKVTAWKGFGRKIFKFENGKGYYPEYNDQEFAFDELIKDGEQFIKTWGKGLEYRVDKIRKLGAKARIIYEKDNYFVFSARAPEAMCVVGDTSWCHRNSASTFWNYNSQRVQIIILNYNSTTDESFIGATIEPDGKVHAAHDKSDKSIQSGGTLENLLKKLNYPKDLIEEVLKQFPTEVRIKLTLDYFMAGSGVNLAPHELIRKLIGINRNVLSGEISKQQWEDIAQAVAQIVTEEKGLKQEQFMKVFIKDGITSISSYEIFRTICGKNYSSKDVKKIKMSSESTFDEIEDMLNDYKQGKLSPKEAQSVQIIKKVYEDKDKVMKLIGSL